MKRGYTVEDYREMLGRIRDGNSRRGDHERFHRRLLRRDGGRFPVVGRAGPPRPVQKQFHLQVQRRPGTKAAELYPGRHSRGCEAAAEQRTLGRAKRDLPGGQPAVLGPHGGDSRRRPEQSRPQAAARTRPTIQLIGRTVHDRIVVFDGPRELTGKILNVVIEKLDPFTLFGKLV